MFELLTILLSVFIARWYFGPPPPKPRWHGREANLNRDVDEWNAREMVEEESEKFYE